MNHIAVMAAAIGTCLLLFAALTWWLHTPTSLRPLGTEDDDS